MQMTNKSASNKNILWLSEIKNNDIPIVGGKNASLGELYNNLAPLGVNVPNGFCITVEAYQEFVKNIQKELVSILNSYDLQNTDQLAVAGKRLRDLIIQTPFSSALTQDIQDNYHQLSQEFDKPNLSVAVRSSATAEDLPDASFAGQQSSYLHVRGESLVVKKVHECFASLFTDRAISYREEKKFNHFDIGLSVTVQKMVASDNRSAGVIFTLDPNSGNKNVILISGSYGLGEKVVAGEVEPDEFLVYKPSLKGNFKAIIGRSLGSKKTSLVYNSLTGLQEECDVTRINQNRFCIETQEVIALAKSAFLIEEHYSKMNGYYCPMDIEWAKDEDSGKLFVVQARPETVESLLDPNSITIFKMIQTNLVTIASSISASRSIGAGKVRILKDLSQMSQFEDGEVLVTESTSPDWVPVMKKASAIITAQGGRTCHAAIVSRELGKPAMVGCTNILEIVNTSQEVTVDCSKGTIAYLYDGICEFASKAIVLDTIPSICTKVFLNTAKPDEAFQVAKLPVNGVGLLRMEFIINNIGIHPMALINYKNLAQEAKEK